MNPTSDDDEPGGSSPRQPALREAIDRTLEIGRSALSRLRRLKSEIADAQAGEVPDAFWPIYVLRAFGRRARRQRISRLTAGTQRDLAALDAATDALREFGVELKARPASRARPGDVLATRTSAAVDRHDPWSGPAHLTEVTRRRVKAILDELHHRREA